MWDVVPVGPLRTLTPSTSTGCLFQVESSSHPRRIPWPYSSNVGRSKERIYDGKRKGTGLTVGRTRGKKGPESVSRSTVPSSPPTSLHEGGHMADPDSRARTPLVSRTLGLLVEPVTAQRRVLESTNPMDSLLPPRPQ